MDSVPLSTIFISLAIVAGGMVGAYLVHALADWFAARTDRGQYQIDDLFVRVAGAPVGVLVGLSALLFALYRIPQVRAQFGHWTGAWLAVFTVTGTWFLANLVDALVEEYAIPYAQRDDTDVDERIVRVVDLTAVYVIWVIGILVALREVGIEVTAFLASLGIVGLSVAFAAKTILSNVLAGVTLTADRNFRVGDRIEVGEYVGDVMEINLHKTIIRTLKNEVVMIPNDVLGRKVIVNHALPEQRTRIDITMGVAYGTDLDRVDEIVGPILRESDRIVSEPGPEINVVSLGDNSVVLQVLAWIDGPRLGAEKRTVRDRVYRRVLARFEQAGIDIPFPQRVVQMQGGDPLRRRENDGAEDDRQRPR